MKIKDSLSLFFLRTTFLLILVGLNSSFLTADENKITMLTNKSKFYPGDPIFFKIQIPKKGYIYLLNLNSDGTIHLIFPNEIDTNNFFEEGTYRFPNKNSDYEWRLDEDPGKETIYLIFSENPVLKLHIRNFRKDESLSKPYWLRRLMSAFHPSSWSLVELNIEILVPIEKN
jgi:hypothetical protein